MKFIKGINLPLLLIVAYLVKIILIVPTFVDAAVLGVLVLPFVATIAHKLITKYIEVKQSVITENDFRVAIMADIAAVKDDVSIVKGISSGSFKTAFKR